MSTKEIQGKLWSVAPHYWSNYFEPFFTPLYKKTLEQLQARAQGASGQMQALGYANQLASQQANQLLQIRALLIAQQNAVTTRMQAEADKEAVQQAASEQLRSGTFQASPSRTW
ncbi:MAG TPA: hypothetical protein PLK54_02690 [Ferruginibacter sp.]|nr:hypothetical protein [Ferruginibacter sp.]